MNPTAPLKVQKIERYSAHLRTVCTALFVPVIVIGLAASVSILAGWTAHISYAGQTFIPSEMTFPSRLLLAAVGVATAAVIFKGLHHVRRLAGNYARREIFTIDSARQIRAFGITCIFWGLVKIAWAFLPLLVSTARAPVYMTSDSIFIGAVIIGISWFAEMAAGLREENDLTI